MNDTVDLLDDPGTIVAVVGANDNPAKYGNIIYRDLRDKGIKVRAVNPSRDTVAGDPCWHSVSELPEPPTIVNIVVPPRRTLEVLAECARIGLRTVWIQPGAADDEVRRFVVEHGFDAIIDACIMVPPRSPSR